ncbi:hypothetical protein C5E07_04815 [Pseudoclavibacter sp. RFBJ3]|nr:hypothetical protein C5C12_05520 [Pseudoclavibacter sp. RFBJ5]PPF93836.1 hypothetical protein C5E07_04815 [Pseudoclavibacter sp. RFBJ3]PPF98554.1 hypothetical protein C5C19_07800 [Pseudoclavibacter sp. RFBH5]PPG24487.1 hypothetical protein C5E13_07070 [Pseudoclavibacter sp. RFBI4]
MTVWPRASSGLSSAACCHHGSRMSMIGSPRPRPRPRPKAGLRPGVRASGLVGTTPADRFAPADRSAPADGVVHLPTIVPGERTVVFPALMALAPVVVALVLWALLSSPVMLAFAFLGPVMAVASYAESRRQSRAEHGRAQAVFESELDVCVREARVLARHDLRELHRSAPGARALISGGSAARESQLNLGFGCVRARFKIQGELRELPDEAHARLEPFLVLEDAPVLADSERVRLTGNPHLMLAVSRALLLQRAAGRVAIGAGAVGEALNGEIRGLRGDWRPVLAADHGPGMLLDFGTDFDPRASASGPSPRPRTPRREVRIRMLSPTRASVELADGQSLTVRPELVTVEELRAFAQRRAPCESGQLFEGPDGDTAAAASTLRLRRVPHHASLAAQIGTRNGVAFQVDLVAAGPHAVVGGTTGSGKSELLVTWVLAMTATRSTRDVQVLCFDFKGGATFDPIAALPHCVGVVTDLDDHEARRAATSLSAEIRFRERALRAAGAKHVGELPSLARLVVVVDEYQALVDADAELQAVFSDISARGRSLGVHLILCAQQPASAVRGATLANCSIRISLRVIAEADSTAVIGSGAAADLPASTPGVAIIVAGDGAARVQVQRSSPDTIAACIRACAEREAHLGGTLPRPPWLPALPAEIAASALEEPSTLDASGILDEPSGRGLAFGIADDTELRRQPTAVFSPELGAMLVIGGPRTGKTGCLAMLAETARTELGAESPAVVVLSVDPETAWDQLWSPELTSRHGLLLADDVDLFLSQVDEPYRSAFAERLTLLLRRSATGFTAVVFTASRATGHASVLVAAAAQTLRLVGGDRAAYVMAGGEPSDHRSHAGPGRANWHGLPCQVARSTRPLRALRGHSDHAGDPRDALALSDTENLLVAARRIEPLRRILEARGFACTTLDAWLGDRAPGAGPMQAPNADAANRRAVLGVVDEWQAQFGLLSRLAAEHPVLLSGLSTGEHRTLLRGDPLPPPVLDARRGAVLRGRSGDMTRIRWTDEDIRLDGPSAPPARDSSGPPTPP